jgi:proline iminopeptidase
LPKENLSFSKLATPSPKSGVATSWFRPHTLLDLGGNVAVWAEQGNPLAARQPLRPSPWLVLHGGPGGNLGASHVAPLRTAGLPWFGFDQRNSGLSEDLDLAVIDLQRYIDDALDVADHLGIQKFHILGGSWGATLALALAAYRPERVVSVVLRAPFVPLRSRVDAFFETLESVAPEYFSDHFGPGARTSMVCECFDVATPEHLLEMSIAWSRLETALLTGNSVQNTQSGFLSDTQELALVRKYRLQAHFLKHDCFLGAEGWDQLVTNCAQASWPLSIVQGLNDKVCPPGGARMLAESLLRATLVELQDTAHLAQSGFMLSALSEAVSRHHFKA